MKGPNGIGLIASSVPKIPISAAYWSSGGWWDAAEIVGANNSPFTVPLPGLAGSTSFVPQSTGTKPIITDAALGGKRGLALAAAQVNFLRNDALAAVLNGTNKQFGVVFDYAQSDVGVPIVNYSIFGFGSDLGPGAEDLFACKFYASAAGGATPEGLAILQSTTNGTISTQNNPLPAVGMDYFRCCISYDGTALSVYLNGSLVSVVPATWQTAAMVVTRMVWGAYPVNGVGFESANGSIRRLGVRAAPITASEQAQINASMLANDLILPFTDPRTPHTFFAGASIMNGVSDLNTAMGIRYWISQYIRQNRLSIFATGTPSGFYMNRGCAAVGGSDAALIAAQCVAQMTPRTKLFYVELGNYEINSLLPISTILNTIVGELTVIRNAVRAQNPRCQIVTYNIPPYSTTAENTLAGQVNAAYPGIWAASDAAFPEQPPIVAYDANAAIGGPGYVQANFLAGGNPHPNTTGYTLLGAAAVAASGPYLDAISPT